MTGYCPARIKKSIVLAVIIFSLVLLPGCESNDKVVRKEVTDSETIKEIWQEYIYDAIPTVMNTDEYNSADDIEPNAIARFCWEKYIAEHDYDYLCKTLEFENENSSERLFPLETALEYAKRYFDIDAIDLTKLTDAYYDSQKQAFTFSLAGKKRFYSYDEKNPWGLVLDKIVYNGDGTLTVTILSYESENKNLVERITTSTLKERQDGSLFFLSGRREDIDNGLVKIKGSYDEFEINNFFERFQNDSLRILGESNNTIIVSTDNQKVPLILINLETISIMKEVNLNTNLAVLHARTRGDNIILGLKDRLLMYDNQLQQKKEIFLPQEIRKGIFKEDFFGYDISLDYSKIAYSDKEGLKVFSYTDNSTKLLADTMTAYPYPDYSEDRPSLHYHLQPRFVDLDSKIITTLSGYEGNAGYYIYDINQASSKRYKDVFEAISTSEIYSDTGMLTSICSLNQQEKQETGSYEIAYLNFNTGEVLKEEKQISGTFSDFIRFPESVYASKDYGVFLTYAESMEKSYINRLNLKTRKIETNLISIEGARVSLVGVLADGRIIFSYYRSTVENGMGVIE